MPTDIVMPQMGESLFRSTITKWLKKQGERVQRDEPLFEISTDKVDAEIPAPASGVLSEIKVPEGSTVQVNTVVGIIDADGAGATAGATKATAPAVGPAAGGGENPVPREAPSARPSPAQTAGTSKGGTAATDGGTASTRPNGSPGEGSAGSAQADGTTQRAQPPQTEQSAQRAQTTPTAVTPSWPSTEEAEEEQVTPEGRRIRSSPLVRKIARENGVNLAEVSGTGLGGRITKEDIQGFVAQRGSPRAAQPIPAGAAGATSPTRVQAPTPTTIAPPMGAFEVPGDVVAMTPMRKKIAERMVESKRISPHVHTIYEVDMTRVVT